MSGAPDLSAPARSSETRGFVLAASGSGFTTLAEGLAASLRAVATAPEIDLFTDTTPTAPSLFNRVHPLERTWFRPKFEALRRSRFDRTIYLDADMIAVADPSDIFDVLDRFDLAAVHNQHRNSVHATTMWRRPIPPAFPQINGGLLAIRKTTQVTALIDAVEAALLSDPDLKRDQVPMRELLYDSDIRFAILPPEYNLMQVRHAEVQGHKDTAPRILHLTRLHAHLTGNARPVRTAEAAIGPVLWRHVERLIANDRTLGGSADKHLRPLPDQGLSGAISVAWRKLRKALRERRR